MSLPANDATSGLSYFRNTASGVTQSPSMASLVTSALPTIGTGLNAIGSFAGTYAQSRALRSNALGLRTEADIASRQGEEQESQTRITGQKVIGQQVAAAGEAGGGYGGSTGRMIAQSARNTVLDALNVRYKAALQRWSFGAQAANLDYEAGQAKTGAYLKAGAALLRGYSGNYTGTTPYYSVG